MFKKLSSNLKLKPTYFVPVLIIFAGLGAALLIRSFANTGAPVAFEAESGAVSGNATAKADSTASGGSFVLFRPSNGASPAPAPAPSPSPDPAPSPTPPPSGSTGSYPQRGEVGFKGDKNSLTRMGSNNGVGSHSIKGSANLSNVYFTTPIYWDGQGGTLTLRNCVVEAGSSSTGAIFAASGGTLDIDGCTISVKGTNSSGTLHGSAVKKIRNTDLSGGGDGVNSVQSGSILERVWVHDLAQSSNCSLIHNDGVQLYSNQSVTIRSSRFELPTSGCNRNAAVFTQGSNIGNITIDKSYFYGGQSMLKSQGGTWHVTNSTFAIGSASLFTITGGSLATWSGNVDQNGKPVGRP